ncbi:DUF3368 domain-containing protein [Sorangium sp. So ce119]|uniref:DUF3368 domain-containing protein n=1 Tax=Sorangium sp. So ce119 TaxID=3133279 RepID=UPI003F6391EA
MAEAISNTSPLLYLHRIGAMDWLAEMFKDVWVPSVDDALARRTAQAAGLVVWGTLKILLEAKSRGITQNVGPWVDKLADAGMWLSDEIRQRILSLAGERGELPP